MPAAALAAIKPKLAPLIDYMRGRALSLDGGIRVGQATPAEGGAHPQAAVITRLLDLPAVIAAAAVGPVNGVPPSLDNRAPIILSVKFIKSGLLADIGTQLRMTDLRPLVGKRAARRHRLHARRSARQRDRALCLDAEAAGRRDRAQRHPLHRGGARRLCAARRLRAALHAAHRGRDRGRRNAAAPSRHARPAVRAAQPHLLQRAAGSRDRGGRAPARRRPRCSTSTSTISRTSTTRSAIRSATS